VKFGFGGFGAKSMIGLDIGSSTVKAVEIEMNGRGGGFSLTHMGVAKLPSEAIVQGAFLNSSAIAAAAVCGHSVIVKKVSLPVMSRSELEEQIRWEAEQYIPFDVNEVNLDFQILDSTGTEGQMDVLLVAAKKDLIDDYVQVIGEAGLIPAVIDVAAFAVENAYEANYETNPSEAVALVNIGAQVVNINIVSDGATAFTRDITTAGNQYTEEIQKALTISFDEAERLKLGGKNSEESQEVVPQEVEQAMQNVSETVIGEISRSLDFFAATTADSRIEKVFLSGGSSRVTGFENAFHERTGLSVELLNPLNQMAPNSKFDPELLEELAPSLGVSIGLAMRRLEF